jgi:hypothetical protein
LYRVAIAATGLGVSNRPSFSGSEYVEDYTEFDPAAEKYVGKTVLILGRGTLLMIKRTVFTLLFV